MFLDRQHLTRPRAHALTARRLVQFVEDVGGVQLDSINVVDRAHYLTFWSRFGPYDRTRLDALVYGRRLLFEYWAHAACLVPTSMLPWWRRAMLDYRVGHTGWSSWLKRNSRTLSKVRDTIAQNGPMANADFEGRRPRGAAGWWNWKPVQHALHYLWMTGALAIHSRRHFHKRFDLLERAMPAAAAVEAVSSEEFRRWHVERTLHALGAATLTDVTGYLTFPRFGPGGRRATVLAMRERGEISAIDVEGTAGPWLVLTRDLPRLARGARRLLSRGTTLLSPFDSLLWYRPRITRLFGFDYRIQVYTPSAKRQHGYYTLPILHDGQLIGRVDAKAHRAERRLHVLSVHFEPWFAAGGTPPTSGIAPDRDVAIAGLGDALWSLARFVAADEVTLDRVVPRRLGPPLRRVVTAGERLVRD